MPKTRLSRSTASHRYRSLFAPRALRPIPTVTTISEPREPGPTHSRSERFLWPGSSPNQSRFSRFAKHADAIRRHGPRPASALATADGTQCSSRHQRRLSARGTNPKVVPASAAMPRCLAPWRHPSGSLARLLEEQRQRKPAPAPCLDVIAGPGYSVPLPIITSLVQAGPPMPARGPCSHRPRRARRSSES